MPILVLTRTIHDYDDSSTVVLAASENLRVLFETAERDAKFLAREAGKDDGTVTLEFKFENECHIADIEIGNDDLGYTVESVEVLP